MDTMALEEVKDKFEGMGISLEKMKLPELTDYLKKAYAYRNVDVTALAELSERPFQIDEGYLVFALAYKDYRIEGNLRYSDNDVIPAINFNTMYKNDSSKDPLYTAPDGTKYDYDDYSFYELDELNSFEGLFKAVGHVKEYIDSVIKEKEESQNVSEKDFDFSHFTEEAYLSNHKDKVQTILDKIGKEYTEDNYFRNYDFGVPGWDSDLPYIKYKEDVYLRPRIWQETSNCFDKETGEAYVRGQLLLDVYLPYSKFENFSKEEQKALKGEHYVESCEFVPADGRYGVGELDLVNVLTIDGDITNSLADKFYDNMVNTVIKSAKKIDQALKPYFKGREIQDLIDAGHWDFDIESYKTLCNSLSYKYSLGDDVEGTQIGTVFFGNNIYPLCIYNDYAQEPGHYVVESVKYAPNDGTDRTTQKHFIFDTIEASEMYFKYLDKYTDQCVSSFEVNKENMVADSLDMFKHDCVEMLMTVGEIFPSETADYRKMKNSKMTFGEQYESKKCLLENLENTRKFFYPKELIEKDKLNHADFKELGEYFDKLSPYIVDPYANPETNNLLMVKAMMRDGLNDARIKIVFDTLSDVDGIHKFSDAEKILKDPRIEDYRKELAYKARTTNQAVVK